MADEVALQELTLRIRDTLRMQETTIGALSALDAAGGKAGRAFAVTCRHLPDRTPAFEVPFHLVRVVRIDPGHPFGREHRNLHDVGSNDLAGAFGLVVTDTVLRNCLEELAARFRSESRTDLDRATLLIGNGWAMARPTRATQASFSPRLSGEILPGLTAHARLRAVAAMRDHAALSFAGTTHDIRIET